MTDYLFSGARIIDPSRNLDEIRDLWVANGRITFSRLDGDVECVNVSEKVIMPGMVDLRSHLHAPESLASVSGAAAAGGPAAAARPLGAARPALARPVGVILPKRQSFSQFLFIYGLRLL